MQTHMYNQSPISYFKNYSQYYGNTSNIKLPKMEVLVIWTNVLGRLNKNNMGYLTHVIISHTTNYIASVILLVPDDVTDAIKTNHM